MEVNIFSKPEEIDRMINSRLEQFPRKGGKTCSKNVSWSDDEIQLIDAVIMDYISSQGLSREQTAQQLESRWDISISTARRYVTECIKRFASNYTEDDAEEQRRIWLERCEAILQDAFNTRDKQSALRALDLMGKTMGLYKDTKDVNVNGDNTIHFDFS